MEVIGVSVPDRIEHEIVVDAPVERVWAVITEPEHIGAWFGDSAEVDLRPGGDMTLSWNQHGSFAARVEQVDAPHLFAFRWARPAGEELRAGNSTLVEFSVAAEGDQTKLRVVESGFPSLDSDEAEKAKYAEENTKGWQAELEDLRRYVAEVTEVRS